MRDYARNRRESQHHIRHVSFFMDGTHSNITVLVITIRAASSCSLSMVAAATTGPALVAVENGTLYLRPCQALDM